MLVLRAGDRFHFQPKLKIQQPAAPERSPQKQANFSWEKLRIKYLFSIRMVRVLQYTHMKIHSLWAGLAAMF